MVRPSLTSSLVLSATLLVSSVGAGTPSKPASEPSKSAPVGIALGDDWTLTLQERVRGEWRDNTFDFNDSVDALTDDSWLEQRLRLGVSWQPASWLRIVAEGQDTREFFADRPSTIGQLGAEGDDTFDLRQGYVEVGEASGLSLRAGRQTLVYGDKRFISSGEWGNASRTFDAVKVHYQHEDWWLDAFTSSVVKLRDERFNQSTWFDGTSEDDQFFSGLYFSTRALAFQTTDVYALQLHQEDAGGTDFVTWGTRWASNPDQIAGWDYAVEMAAQTGHVKGKDLTAFAGHWDLGHTWGDMAWKPRLGLEYSYASGDSDATDGKTSTFQNLFPTNHLYYGYMDLFAWQNLHNPAAHFSVQPSKSLKASLDYHAFWLADTSDSWYRANITSTARPITRNASSFAGTELDITLVWKAHKHLEVQAGYSHFFAGDYLKASGSNDDADFAYLMMTLTY